MLEPSNYHNLPDTLKTINTLGQFRRVFVAALDKKVMLGLQ
jgi:hypothetical protein